MQDADAGWGQYFKDIWGILDVGYVELAVTLNERGSLDCSIHGRWLRDNLFTLLAVIRQPALHLHDPELIIHKVCFNTSTSVPVKITDKGELVPPSF